MCWQDSLYYQFTADMHHASVNQLTEKLVDGVVQHFEKALTITGNKRSAVRSTW
jgi:hypothetical protein